MSDDDGGGAGDAHEGGAEQLGERLVPLVRHDSAHVVRLNDLGQISHSEHSPGVVSRQRAAESTQEGERGESGAGPLRLRRAGRILQVAAPCDLHRVGVAPGAAERVGGGPGGPLLAGWCTGGLAHGVGERLEVVAAGAGRGGVDGEADDLPAARRREPLRVLGTQVVAVRFGVGGEGAENGGGVRVDVRQRRDGGTAASGARTATYRAHDVGPYRTLERAATTLHEVTLPCRPGSSETPDLLKDARCPAVRRL